MAAAGRQLEALEFPVQFGGAAGTLAAGTVLTEGAAHPFTLADALARSWAWQPRPAPWHTNRLAVTSLGNALATVLDAFGKIAADVLFLSRPEVAELAEPRAAGRGVSSAMPQKQNPVLSVLVRSAALQAPQLAAQLHLAAANFNDERPDGAWHTEWPALRQLLALALGAAGHLRELAEGLQVFPDAMRRNLDLAGPLLLAEGVGAAVAPLLEAGRPHRQGAAAGRGGPDPPGPAAEQAAPTAGCSAAPFRRPVSDARLEELLDPASYLGQAAEITRRILAAFPDIAAPAHTYQTPVPLTPTRTEPTVAKPTLKAALLSPQRPLGEHPLLVVGPSLGTSSSPVDRDRFPAGQRLRRRGLGPARPRCLTGSHRNLRRRCAGGLRGGPGGLHRPR